MAQESINQLRQSIDKLKDVIDTVEAKRLLASREADSPYLTELLSVSDKLHMIKSTVDALISKLPLSSEITQTRQPKGRDNRDSGLPSVDSAAFSSRDSSFLEDKEFSSSDHQCPSCLQPLPNQVQEKEDPDSSHQDKVSTENEDSTLQEKVSLDNEDDQKFKQMTSF